MKGKFFLRISFACMLIIFSWLLHSCVTPTADKSMATWKHQPGTSTYISPEYNIKLTFPNNRWSVYTSPHEVPQGMRRFWRSSQEGDPVDVLIAQSLDNIVLKLTIIYTPLTEPASLDGMMDHMVRKLGASKKGEHSVESRLLQRPDGRIGIITFRVKAETPTKWLYAFVEEKGRLLWFVFHTYDMNPINWEKSECWYIINSYEYFDKPGYGQTVGTEPKELMTGKKYIKIEVPDSVFSGGKVKFNLIPGDILEVIRKKLCLDGKGECWEVKNIKTGETGFVNAERMKNRHYVYTKE